jgi:hypothetical protein
LQQQQRQVRRISQIPTREFATGGGQITRTPQRFDIIHSQIVATGVALDRSG